MPASSRDQRVSRRLFRVLFDEQGSYHIADERVNTHGVLPSHCQEEACQPWKTPRLAQSTDGSALWSPGTGQRAPTWSSSAAIEPCRRKTRFETKKKRMRPSRSSGLEEHYKRSPFFVGGKARTLICRLSVVYCRLRGAHSTYKAALNLH